MSAVAQDTVPPWCLIESDPGVFTSLVRDFGVKDVEVEEVWDPESTFTCQDGAIHGVIFLFKWDVEYARMREKSVVRWSDVPHVFFAKQVIPNACATQAILSVLLNTSNDSVDLGADLTSLRSFICDFDPALKGITIGQSESIMRTHNSFATPVPIHDEQDPRPQRDEETEDDFHFVAFVPIDGTVYELDGLLSGPLPVSTYDISSPNSWLSSMLPVIYSRIEFFSMGEIRFNLMVVREDKRAVLRRKLAFAEDLPDDEVAAISNEMEQEDSKHAGYDNDNVLRRHNYLPLAVEMLKLMAAQGTLRPEIEKAVQKANNRDSDRT